MPSDPRKIDGANRPDETPASFADLKPPGYWDGKRFVHVRLVSDEEFWGDDTLQACLNVERRRCGCPTCLRLLRENSHC